MNREKINRIFALSMLVSGVLNILAGLFRELLPRQLQIAVAIAQVLAGCAVLYTGVLKLREKF